MGGEPLEGATVVFEPSEGRPSNGKTDGSGNYELIYTKDAMGASVGRHTVRIMMEPDPDNAEAELTEIPAKYNTNSELTAEVEPGENTFDFDLDAE